MPLKLLLARPRGFCAGVTRAIETVEWTLKHYPGPIYVRKQIVHNSHVTKTLREHGASFVDALTEVPAGSTIIFSAHGVSPEVRAEARAKHLDVIDATCPLVTKVHQEAVRFAAQGRSIILIGEAGHDEVIGTMGEVPGKIQLVQNVEDARTVMVPDPDRLAVICQTTLSCDDTRVILDVLRARFPKLITPVKDDICYATQNRQAGVKALAHEADVVLVVGSRNSANSNRLREVAEENGVRAYMIEDATALDPAWLAGARCVALTSGASSPEYLVHEVVECLMGCGVTEIEEIDVAAEDVEFQRPRPLVQLAARHGAALPQA
jgi:4-hydroxy-3-methylbut-2-en-1-yl diphosphate reductase